MMKQPLYFGIRHLSPAGAFYLRRFLNGWRPELVLVEGPEDFNDQLGNMVRPETQPPIAVLAYTKEAPVQTILYPFAEYSPEYQAVRWCKEAGAECRFIDLPSDVFLALSERRMAPESTEPGEEAEPDRGTEPGGEAEPEKGTEPGGEAEPVRGTGPGGEAGLHRDMEPGSRMPQADQGEEGRMDVYRRLDEQAGEDGHETFWERTLEHTVEDGAYRAGAEAFGRNLRALTFGKEEDWAETVVRESYMSRRIVDAVRSGIQPDRIVVVTGAYHVEGLRAAVENALLEAGAGERKPGQDNLDGQEAWEDQPEFLVPAIMSDAEIAALPRLEASHTLMPYSFYRLSSRAGYGAGNKAPAYYGLLWEALQRGEPYRASYSYLSRIAAYQREHGSHVSSAEVIEAVRLACSLAELRAGSTHAAIPALRDLRDAAVACMGGGSLSALSLAVADTEIGTGIGSLPDGVSRTSIQEDFYRQLKALKLEKYRDLSAQDLKLDLRENRQAKSEKAAFLDLSRSSFLHRLRVLGVSFVLNRQMSQDNATWAEHWVLRWSPEAEIELVETALKGDTIGQAASFSMKERVENASGMSEIAAVIEDAFTCGMPAAVGYATAALQAMAVDAASLEELAATAHRLSVVVQYGSIRRLDPAPLQPILEQLFFRACLLLPGACVCDDGGGKAVAAAMEQLNICSLAHEFLAGEAWLAALSEVAGRDDLNTILSGLSAAILLERGKMDTESLQTEVRRRLSKGVPADLGAGWFAGLAMKNRYALISRLSLWESLDEYLGELDDEEFKRALVFLRRAFADFTSMEKDEIAENLGELWGLNGRAVSEAVNAPLAKEAEELIESLDEFDFDI